MSIVAWEPEKFESVVRGDIGEAMSRPYNPEETRRSYQADRGWSGIGGNENR